MYGDNFWSSTGTLGEDDREEFLIYSFLDDIVIP